MRAVKFSAFAFPIAFLVCLLSYPLVLPTKALAQQNGSDPLFVDVQPSAPQPGAETTITIDSSTMDLSQASMRWSLNGTPSAAGSGLRTFTFTMGPAGKSTTVTLSVVPVAGSAFTRTFTFTPGSVTLLWEADTYVPPFYTGTPLYTPGSKIRVQAIPDVQNQDGSPIDTSDLNFKWSIDADAYADKSGLGRDVLDFTGHWSGGIEEVWVDVLRKDGSKAAHGALFINDSDPVVLLYKKDPLHGTLYNRALKESERLTEIETTIVAEPYYMSGNKRKFPSRSYSWTMNGKEITPQGDDPSVITLRQNSSQSGSADLSFSIQNTSPSQLLQHANALVTLVFGTGSNSFGI